MDLQKQMSEVQTNMEKQNTELQALKNENSHLKYVNGLLEQLAETRALLLNAGGHLPPVP